jgi:hypothetical protein
MEMLCWTVLDCVWLQVCPAVRFNSPIFSPTLKSTLHVSSSVSSPVIELVIFAVFPCPQFAMGVPTWRLYTASLILL